MVHQQAGVVYDCLQVFYLPSVCFYFLAGGLPACDGIVYFYAGIKQCLVVREQCLFLLCFGYFQVGDVRASVEEGLHEGTDCLPQPAFGVGYGGSAVGPTGGTAQRDGGVEGCSGGVGDVEVLFQRGLGLPDVWPHGEQFHGYSYGEGVGECLFL